MTELIIRKPIFETMEPKEDSLTFITLGLLGVPTSLLLMILMFAR